VNASANRKRVLAAACVPAAAPCTLPWLARVVGAFDGVLHGRPLPIAQHHHKKQASPIAVMDAGTT